MAANAQKFALIDMEYILKEYSGLSKCERAIEPSYQTMAKRSRGNWPRKHKACSQTIKRIRQTLSAAQKTKKEDEIVAKEKSAAELKRKYFGPEGELF